MMRIGFDAKRLFFNRSGLGNYSRSTVKLLSEHFKENKYLLFTPKHGNREGFSLEDNMQVVMPSGIYSVVPSLWRSYAMASSLRREKLDIYHGLSNELPYDIRAARCRSIVTMHDLIFVRYPELYKPADVALYKQKYGRSCRKADKIIAISQQTRDDLVELWGIPEQKIEVVYQGCNPIFYQEATPQTKAAVRTKYSLPERYILSVGSIEERKNLLLTVQAMAMGKIDIDLVACGKHTPYADRVMNYAQQAGIAHRVHMLHNVNFEDLPAIYQMGCVMVYASIFEGFGIPILEGFNSGVPVITSQGGVFPETGGDAAMYVDPQSVDSMINAIRTVTENSALREEMITKGYAYRERFREHHIAENMMRVYRDVMG